MAVDLDPKAVTCDELFGIINPATREWKDGRRGAGVTSGTAAVPSGVGLSETPSVPEHAPWEKSQPGQVPATAEEPAGPVLGHSGHSAPAPLGGQERG